MLGKGRDRLLTHGPRHEPFGPCLPTHPPTRMDQGETVGQAGLPGVAAAASPDAGPRA